MEAVLLIAIPLGLAFLGIMSKELSKILLILGALLNAVLVFLIEDGMTYLGGFRPPFGITLVMDAYSRIGLIGLNVLFALIVLLLFEKMDKMAPIMLVTLAALNGILLTGDLFNLFVFLEIASIGAYLITGTNKRWTAVFNYLVMTTVGASMYLLGVAILYAQTGTLNMAEMAGRIGYASSLPIILVFAGLAVEVKLMPVGGWVKGILEKSDAFSGTMIGSIYAGVMVMAFGRVFGSVLKPSGTVVILFMALAILTLIFAEAAAFSSKKIKEILLYSSVAQSALAVLLILNNLVFAAVLVVASNVVAKLILFMIAGHLEEDDLETNKGQFVKNPMNGLAFTIGSLSLIGLPLFFGFPVKVNMLGQLFDGDHYLLPIIILGVALVEGAYMIRMLVGLWNGGGEGELSVKATITAPSYEIKKKVCVAMVLFSLTLIGLGLFPSPVVKVAKEAQSVITQIQVTTYYTEEGGAGK